MALQTVILTVLLLVLVPAYIVYKPPKVIIDLFQYASPDVLFQVATSRKIIALTIDDAPSQHTEEILSILQRNNASATFFVIGDQVEHGEGILRSIITAGSELGNHAMHDEPSVSLDSSILRGQIDEVDKYIKRAYNELDRERPARYFRPGSGIFSRRVLGVAAEAGYRTILGSIYPHDPFISYSFVNAWHILSMVRPGAIIICHDRRSWTAPMLSKVLPRLTGQGWEVVSISNLLERTAKG